MTTQFGRWDEGQQDRFFLDTWKAHPHEVLICDGMPCGYICVDFNPDAIDLREIVILPEFQSRGIGSKILADLTAQSKSRGVPVVLRVLKLNRAADLYRRFGFQDCGSTPTHILMRLQPRID